MTRAKTLMFLSFLLAVSVVLSAKAQVRDEPPSGLFGELDTIKDTVAATAKTSELSGVTQNWDKALPAAERFVILAAFNNDAVRDNNTGLVWERAPASPPTAAVRAFLECVNKNVGKTRGWRLPAIAELASLIGSSSPGPDLPPGHPFLNIQPANYWSASQFTEFTETPLAWSVDFGIGSVNTRDTTGLHLIWCVRGPMQGPAY